MIRTNVVKLTTIPAFAYRQKLQAGDTGIIIVRPDVKQPGIGSISKKTGEAVPTVNTDKDKYPLEAFIEAMDLTRGMPFKKQGSIKVTKEMFVEETDEPAEEPAELNVDALAKITEHYTDKNDKLSYDLINKELIKFAKSSTIVGNMIAAGDSLEDIRNYIVLNKFRNIAGNDELTDKEVFLIADTLDQFDKKNVFKDLNGELKKMLAEAK
ncbi:MAG: hypothetical protein J6E46_04135 [Faecalicoccus sp.]|nr:hypothetical protein [Faecalicoccus sp.]